LNSINNDSRFSGVTNFPDDSSSSSNDLSSNSNDSSSSFNDSSSSSNYSSSNSSSSESPTKIKPKILKFENLKNQNINVCYANSAIQSLLGCGKNFFELVSLKKIII
jgi:hypothetical protein